MVLRRWWSRRLRGYWHLPLLLIGAILMGAGAARLVDLARDFSPRARVTGPWARGVLARLPPDVSLRAPWSAYAPLRAVQVLEGRRPDIRLVYSDRFLRGLPDLGGATEDFAITVGEEAASGPLRPAVRPLGGPTDVEIKGVAGLSLGPLRLAEPIERAQLYELPGR